MRALLDVPMHELLTWLKAQGQPTMRARQVLRWIFEGRADSFETMSDLPKALRESLAREFSVFSTRIERHLTASDGTQKLLLRLADEQLVESVLLHEDNRHTVCISTQVGCGMGCVFCASGLNGLERNLTPGEILEQLIRLRNLLSLTPNPSPRSGARGVNARLTHVVVMGMGEPLANLDNLLQALEVTTAKDGLGIGARHITISTVGLPAKMKQLAERKKQYHLAVSLHAPNDGLRTQIVPTNDQVGIEAILEAADYFYAQTGRQVTYEYVVLGGLNDEPSHAEELARLLQGRQAHINLIPFNDVEGLPYQRPLQTRLTEFVARLRRRGLVVHVRKRKGADIDAACGQLRRSVLQTGDPPPLVALGLSSAQRNSGRGTGFILED